MEQELINIDKIELVNDLIYNYFGNSYGGIKMYYTYMIRCKDNSIYTGMTNDIKKKI